MNKLITNNQNSNFYNQLTILLEECSSFYFCVAFTNFSGVQLLLESLYKCQEENKKGKILTSTYLNFTDPKALEKLNSIPSIELKVYDSNDTNRGFHPKAYIFEFEDCYKILIGSSNITASAFKSNIEWNIKTINNKDELFSNEILNEFNILWNESFIVDDDFLLDYKDFHKKQTVNKSFKYKKDIKINFMQEQALKRLDFFRGNNEKKALVVAATGSGKTYLAALDAKNVKPKKLLFVVHRENILLKAKESFEDIIDNKSCGLFTGSKKETNKDYIFCTIQTLTLYFTKFKKNEFDYIIVDEAHHISSPSYEKILKYFDSEFLLGLTATPNRGDGKSVYDYFDDNLACDIRLNDALEHRLISPFHYYGISDINTIDYENIDIKDIDVLAKILMINKRVDYIIEKMNFYSFSGKKRKVLAFCVSKEHAKYMSDEFNKRGINSICLTSSDSIESRENQINMIEDDNSSLEVIFSVDIFNEGLDIPSINTVLMLRPTNSSVVFIQQLGRGLRKHKDKEFLTLIDFIGNHSKAYMVALSLIGDKKIDKESLKLSFLNNFANIKNAHISIDEISKQRILKQIEEQNFNSIKYLKEQYYEFKKDIGNKIPFLEDYIIYEDVISPLSFISESKSYIEFLSKVEHEDKFNSMIKDELFLKACRFLESLLPIKRVYEFAMILYLIDNNCVDEKMANKVLNKYLVNVSSDTIRHCFSYLSQDYFDVLQKKRFLKLVDYDGKTVKKSDEFEKILKQEDFKNYLKDVLNYGIIVYEKSFGNNNYGIPFLKLYEKYNMLNIAKLCNFPKIHSSFRGSGFLKYQNDFFLFITIEKDKFSKSSKYENSFLNKELFTYVSKPSMSCEKGDGEKLIQNKNFDVRLHIFVRKFSHVDKKVQNFIYLGLANSFKYNGNKPINLTLKLETPLTNHLYEEFTKIV